MAGIGQDTLWQFASMVFGKGKSEPTNREQATFLRTDSDGTQWVRLSGSSNETPVNGRTLASAKAGDVVEWSIEDGKLSIIGNATTPSVGSSYVDNEVKVVTRQVDAIRAEVVETAELVADKASIGQLEAESARISDLEADTADIDTIRANAAKVQNLTAAQLEADHATIGTLDTTYMHANMANADVAWINNGTIRDGAIVSAMINDVSANKLTAGTINGSVINVTNLNADNITAGTINGQRIGTGSLSLDKLSESVYTESEVDTIVDGLNDRIDGAIETHTGTAVPTLNNSPASSWNTTALKDEHVGDVYYVVNSQSQQNGYCYRFTKSGSTYSWQLIKDSDVTAALSRLTTAEGKITSIESFDSTVSSFMSNTDSELTSVKSRASSLETRMTDAEGDISEKVDTSTFNTLSQTVDGNSASITSMSTVISNNGLTSSTNITNTVNTVSQTASGNSSKISQLTTTLGTNADGTTKAGDVVHRTSAIEQDVTSFKTTVSETYATQTALATTNDNVAAAQTAADNAATSASNAQTTANTANNKQVAFSATSSTGATTAAKVAACTNFPPLAAGVTVTVRFSTANTSSGAITLDVNSTGAKTVYVNGAATSSSNQLLWATNANVTFTYDGSYWRVDSEPRTWYGTGGVAAATAAKTATINEVVICKGTTVVLNMTYENTSTSATLNVTSTGAKNIYYGTTTTRPTTSNGYGWGAGSTVSLTFDGQYWRIGDTTALARLTAAESTISSHTTSIEQNASAIALKADSSTTYTKTDVDGLISTEVTNRNAAITAKANEITSSVSETYATKSSVNGKADASDVTALAGRVTTAESNITQNANNIALKVSESDVTGNYIVGKINLNSTTASIAAEHINLQGAVTISDLSSDAQNATLNSNISVGGRNLVVASKISNGYLAGNGTTGAMDATRKEGYSDYIPVSSGESLVFQAWVTVTDSSTEYLWMAYEFYNSSKAYIGSRPTKYHGTVLADGRTHNSFDGITVPSDAAYIRVTMRRYNDGVMKLERGNKATDWSPAPEDTEAYADESAYLSAKPNIAPLGSVEFSDVYDATTNPDGYWRTTFANWFTQLDDGWIHVYRNNSSGTSAYTNASFRPSASPSVFAGKVYTILTEIRNNASTGTGTNDLYLQQVANNQFWGNTSGVVIDEDHVTTTTTVSLLTCGQSYVLRSYRIADTDHLTAGTPSPEMFRYNFRVAAGATLDFDFRMSVYEGIYDGPYKPYSGTQLFATQTDASNAAKTATSYVTEITGQNGIMVHPSTDQTTGVRVTSDVDILRSGTSVINIGTDDAIRIGADDNVQMLLESDGLEIDNEVGDKIFGIESSSSGSTTVTAALVTWSTTSSVDTTARTVSDSMTAAGEPIVTATVNGTDYTLESTHVNTTVTAGTGVTVALTSSGVSYVQDLMVIEVDEDDVETVVPCELSVEYQRAVTDVATLDFSGKQVIHGSGIGMIFTNDEWSSNNQVDTYFEARNEATGAAIHFGVGTGGQNRGIWDSVAGSWLINRTASNDTVINGPKFSVAASGNVKSTYQVRVTGNGTTADGQKLIALRSNNVGNRGLFDETLNKWIMFRSLAGNDHLGGGKWYVDDPYNTSTNFKLGDPQRITGSGSYTAGTSDTMGPYVTVTAGKWLVTGNWIFNNTSSNTKRLVIGFYRSTTSQAYTYRIHTTASSNSAHRLEVVDTITIDAASERLTLYASSSPASTSAATQYIVAIRLT